MAISPSRVCWEASTWIALIQQETIPEGGIQRFTRCRSVIEQAKKGKMEIVYCALCLAEVCKDKGIKDSTNPDEIAKYFEIDYLLPVALDTFVGERARALMMMGLPKLKPQDACHLATAAVTPGVTELHTFDKRLLALDGRVAKADGSPLRICWPDVGGPPPPLLTETK